jgi:hypothetical protein
LHQATIQPADDLAGDVHPTASINAMIDFFTDVVITAFGGASRTLTMRDITVKSYLDSSSRTSISTSSSFLVVDGHTLFM